MFPHFLRGQGAAAEAEVASSPLMLMFHGREQINLGLAAVLGRKPQVFSKRRQQAGPSL